MKVRLFLTLALALTGFARYSFAQDSLGTPRDYVLLNIELANGKSMFANSVERTPYDELLVNDAEDTLLYRKIKRITYIGNPLYTAPELEWDSIPHRINHCECDRLSNTPFFSEAHLGGAYRGMNTYESQTADGVLRTDTKAFGFDEAGTASNLQLDLSAGFRFDAWRIGLTAGLMPTDGTLFIPVGLHAAYDLTSESCFTLLGMCPNLFANLGLPLDFETGAPIIGSDLKRQRKFLSGGLGLERNIGQGLDLSIDLGAEWLTLPMNEIDCCPDIPRDERFPVRSITAAFLAIGLSF